MDQCADGSSLQRLIGAAAWPARTSASGLRRSGCLDQRIYSGTALAPSKGPEVLRQTAIPRRVSPQLNVCNLSFSELSAWRSNTCVAMPEKFAGLPSLSLPLALQFAVP